jgi:hypothetical protein
LASIGGVNGSFGPPCGVKELDGFAAMPDAAEANCRIVDPQLPELGWNPPLLAPKNALETPFTVLAAGPRPDIQMPLPWLHQFGSF